MYAFRPAGFLDAGDNILLAATMDLASCGYEVQRGHNWYNTWIFWTRVCTPPAFRPEILKIQVLEDLA